jgi:neutral trehalase
MDEFFEAPGMEESAKKSGVKPPCALATALWLRPEFWIPTAEYAVQTLVEDPWDSPNGWAPLQWLTIQGLRNYGQDDLGAPAFYNYKSVDLSFHLR